LMFVFSVAAWFPGGATRSQPSNRYSRPLAEPDVVRYTIRLPDRLQDLYGQRAYVVPIMGRFEPLTSGQKAKFALTLENTGNTPAIDLKSWAYLKLLDTSLPDPIPVKPEKVSGNATILGPHGRIEINLTSEFEFDQSTVELIQRKKQRIYVLGMVYYKDVLGESHELPICGYHTGEGNNAAICTKKEK